MKENNTSIFHKDISYPLIHAGSCLLLTLLACMCLIIFSMLSLSQAIMDKNYSGSYARQATAYYQQQDSVPASDSQDWESDTQMHLMK